MYWGLVCGEGVKEHLEEDKEEVRLGRCDKVIKQSGCPSDIQIWNNTLLSVQSVHFYFPPSCEKEIRN